MLSFRSSRCRGVVIVFVLMALIALLALTVVFFSRYGREGDSPEMPLGFDEITTHTLAASPLYHGSTTAPLEMTLTPAVVIPPPPATPIPASVDPKTLPPEG